MSVFEGFLENQGVHEDEAPAFQAELESIATEANLSPELLGRLVILTANILQSSGQIDRTITPELSREDAIKTLTTDLPIFNMVDYWKGTGAGIKATRGIHPDGLNNWYIKRPGTLNRYFEGLGLWDGWHYGQGVVAKANDSNSDTTTYILDFQAHGRNAISDSRPQAILYSTIPNLPEYEPLKTSIEADPALLLDVFPIISKIPETAQYTEGVSLVVNKVIDVTDVLNRGPI